MAARLRRVRNDPTGDLVFGDDDDDALIGGNVAADTIFGGTGNDSIQAFATASADATARSPSV